ncbi:MAG TPA: VWA domain-containing protein [Chloroflexota bacterium]|jgi:Mg-chelatase subunit ChlD|nr:VWA domain-containing protein [Chloroflexota bacterium]
MSGDGSDERLRRWRLVLGDSGDEALPGLGRTDQRVDQALGALYDADRTGGLGSTAPGVARWLGDIRGYFPTSVVRVMQRDALERLGLKQLLLEPELLASVEPDVHLVATLIALSHVIPSRTRETARAVVRQVVEEIERRLADPLRQAVHGALSRSLRTTRPRLAEIDWPRTVQANLKHYLPEQRTVVPQRLVGYGRKRQRLKDVIVAIDQSGSMAESVVYASVLGAVMASIPSLRTRLVVFDTAVVDMTESLTDPVDVLFGVQLGGGTDIGAAVDYCASLVTRPADTVMVLISDLFEGGIRERLLHRVTMLVGSGVRFVALLALSDSGHPMYDHALAAELANLGVPAFACTPNLFPELLAAALSHQDLQAWAAANDLT